MVLLDTLVTFAAFAFLPVQSFELHTDFTSIRRGAATLAKGLVELYNGTEPGQTPGILSDPYYWWEAGAVFDALVHHQNLTGDPYYNDVVSQALLFQTGENRNFMPINQTKNLGNDDQSTWALAALSAAQEGFPGSGWLELAEAVFNNQVLRWNSSKCGGGLRWQIFTFNAGFDYMNSVSTGQFFQLASRLAQHTGNGTYSEWATKAYDWTTKIGLINSKWQVFDGVGVATECTKIDRTQRSSASGTYILGAANMYNITSGETQAKWKVALDGLLENNIATFFPGGIATELCEASIGSTGECDVDQRAYKGVLASQLVGTVRVAPYTSEKIRPILNTTAVAAAKACGSQGECVMSWGKPASTKETNGVGERLSALAYVQALLLWEPVEDQCKSRTTANLTTIECQAGNATSASPSGKTTGPSGSGSASPTTTPNSGAVLGSRITVVVMGGLFALSMLTVF